MILPYVALAIRIFLVGYEKIVFKQLSRGVGSLESVFVIFTIGTFLLLPALVFVPPPENYRYWLYATFSGAIYTLQTVFYVKALREGEASLVSPLYYFNLFFLLLLTTVFLSESLNLMKIAGISLLVFGSSFLKREGGFLRSMKALFSDRACQFMLISSFLVAMGRTIDGFSVQRVHWAHYTFALCITTDVWLAILMLIRKRFGKAWQLFRRRPWLSLGAAGVDAYAYFFFMLAITGIEVSVAEPASMLGLIVTVLMAKYIFKENVSGRVGAVLVMIAGAWLLFF